MEYKDLQITANLLTRARHFLLFLEKLDQTFPSWEPRMNRSMKTFQDKIN